MNSNMYNLMKKYILFLSLLLSFWLSTPVFASETLTPIRTAIPAPTNVERKNVDGTEYIIKTFEATENLDPSTLVEHGYKDGGYFFTHLTTEKKENESEEKKEVVETVKVETSSKSLEDILKRLATTINYDADGFSGVLNLDTTSILTEVSGYSTKTWTVSTVQEYPGLMFADPSYVPQTATKDGQTLALTGVDWVVTGSGLAGDTLVPTEYKATASYSKKVSSQVPNGYITTANYKGTVVKKVVDKGFFVLTYIGTPLASSVPTPVPVEVENAKEPFHFPWAILVGIVVFLGFIGGGFFLIMFIKSRQGVQIYNLIEKDYICIGRQVLDNDKPTIDLNLFKDLIQTNSFNFVLDKPTSKKFYGRNIAVTLEDITIMHMVKGYAEQYKFNLELGGMLDVK